MTTRLFPKGTLPISLGLAALVAAIAPAQAHHVIEITGLKPSAFNGLLSGLAHPVLGPDHLLFLLALALTGLRQRWRWMLGLLVVGLLGSAAGLIGPGLPGAELLAGLTLGVEAMVLLGILPKGVLLPSMALHGYVLSASVLGWSAMPVGTYLVGLLISQAVLLLVALSLLQPAALNLHQRGRRIAALLLFATAALMGLSQVLA